MSRCRFAFAAAERGNHAVARLCRAVGASVSGFYAWLRAIPSVRTRAETEAELRGLMPASSPPLGARTARGGSTPS